MVYEGWSLRGGTEVRCGVERCKEVGVVWILKVGNTPTLIWKLPSTPLPAMAAPEQDRRGHETARVPSGGCEQAEGEASGDSAIK